MTLLLCICFQNHQTAAQERNYEKEDMQEVWQAEGMVADFLTNDPLIVKRDSLWVSEFEVHFDNDSEKEEFVRAVDRNERFFNEIRVNVEGEGRMARVAIIMNENKGKTYLAERLRDLGVSHYTHRGDTRPIEHLDVNETVQGRVR